MTFYGIENSNVCHTREPAKNTDSYDRSTTPAPARKYGAYQRFAAAGCWTWDSEEMLRASARRLPASHSELATFGSKQVSIAAGELYFFLAAAVGITRRRTPNTPSHFVGNVKSPLCMELGAALVNTTLSETCKRTV